MLRADGSVVSHDTRYFVTSLSPETVTAGQLLAHARSHWQVENSHFFVKDRWWDEDRHHTRRPGLAEHLAIFNSMALTVLHGSYGQEQPLRARADRINWQPQIGLKLLGLT